MSTEIESILQHIEIHGPRSIYGFHVPLDKKIKTLKRFLVKYPDDETAYSIYADYLGDNRQYQEAFAAFSTLVERYPFNGSYRNKLIKTYYHMGRLEECYNMCSEEYFHDDHSLAEMYYYKASVCIAWNNADEAWEWINRSIKLNDEYAHSRFTKGYVYYMKKDFKNAIKEYNKATDLDPDHAGAWFNKACLYSLMKRYERAVECLEMAITTDEHYIKSAEEDEELEGLRETPGYCELIERYKKIL